ncbi:MAG: hypothetical protein IKX23_02930 [Treponema sp.]|nr:hypothetical protein [Treponema sp.]
MRYYKHSLLLLLKKNMYFVLDLFLITFLANSYFFIFYTHNSFTKIFIPCILLLFFIFCNIIPSPYTKEIKSKKLRVCADGNLLLKLFLGSTAICIIIFCILLLKDLIKNPVISFSIKNYLIQYALFVYCIEFILFWNGMIRILLTSRQLGIKYRVIAAACGLIPILHLIVLSRLLLIVDNEILIENNRLIVDEKRHDLQICKTKYPILMVHGIFFRDFKRFNYWGRIPGELIKNGAQIFYGNQESARPVKDTALEVKNRILDILKETGAKKVNIIAHSKGGLDSRYAISILGMEKYVASLTTINTPHRGTEFAEYLLEKIPEKQKQLIATTYNKLILKLGDKNPDLIAAAQDLTGKFCRQFNKKVLDSKKVYYQSVGSKLNLPTGGRFPLNFSYYLVNEFDGANDGLVGEYSCSWGEKFQFLTTYGKRGISHGDMIDLNRENFDGFDVQEFFVQLVSDLREKGF